MADLNNILSRSLREIADGIESSNYNSQARVVLTTVGSEHGPEELIRGAELAVEKNPGLEVILVGPEMETELRVIPSDCLEDAHKKMEELLEKKEADGAVTLHYSFPLGVATVGRVITPALGREMIISTTTGTTDSHRVVAMMKNAILGIATARSLGKDNPTLGILNIEGANLVDRNLKKLAEAGYEINFASSARKDGGTVMRGNDLLRGTPDIMVTDSLTGNILMKLFSAFTTGGVYEATGYGYGPGLGRGYNKTICIISRASGAPVVANALLYAARVSKEGIHKYVQEEITRAEKAGLKELLEGLKEEKDTPADNVKAPAPKSVGEEIPGIDILEIDEAKKVIWQAGIYAETGMGCTGPVLLVAEEDLDQAKDILAQNGYIS